MERSASQITEPETEQRNSLESPANANARELRRRKSTEQMEIDEFGRDEFLDNIDNNNLHESVTVTSVGIYWNIGTGNMYFSLHIPVFQCIF